MMSPWIRAPCVLVFRHASWLIYCQLKNTRSPTLDTHRSAFSSLIHMELVEHADELMQYAEVLLGDHQAIMRHDDRTLAEDRMVK
jgi:hypothetical protein